MWRAETPREKTKLNMYVPSQKRKTGRHVLINTGEAHTDGKTLEITGRDR